MTLEPTTIDLLGIRMDEPLTTFTDLMVSAVCYYAFWQIHKNKPQSKLFTYMKLYFLSMGLATTIGGLIGHGFFYLFSFAWKLPGWVTSMFSVALLERASIEYCKPHIRNEKVFRFFKWLNVIELTTFIVITFVTLDFFYVQLHSAYGMLVVVCGFQTYAYLKTKSQASKLALVSVGVLAIASVIYMGQIGFPKWFNYLDISHILMTASAWLFYRSAMEMQGSPPPARAVVGEREEVAAL